MKKLKPIFTLDYEGKDKIEVLRREAARNVEQQLNIHSKTLYQTSCLYTEINLPHRKGKYCTELCYELNNQPGSILDLLK